MRFPARAFVCTILCGLVAPALAQNRPGDFDFYVLSLSWSPGFCATEGDPASAQCEGGSGLVVHGLWPQYERGYPEFCSGRGEPSPSLVQSMSDIMPEPGLTRHQWRKHGTCTGTSARKYFATTRSAWERLTIPEVLAHPAAELRASARDLETAFIAANPGLREDGIAVACGSGWLREIRVCLDRALAFRGCPEVDERGCRQRGLRLVPQ